jgi:hypothetical protein
MTIRLSTKLRNDMMGKEALISAITSGNDNTIELNITGGDDTITRDAGSWITDGFVAGDILKAYGCTTGANDTAITGLRPKTIAALTITLDGAVLDTDEALPVTGVICAANGGSMKDVMRNGILRIYSGSQPANADTAYSGTMLCEFTVSSGAWVAGAEGNGLEFGDETDGYLEKCDGEVWSGVAAASGTAGWFRFYANATDAGGASTILPRIDGSVGTSGADLNMASTSITLGNTYTIDSFKLTFPYQYGA